MVAFLGSGVLWAAYRAGEFLSAVLEWSADGPAFIPLQSSLSGAWLDRP